MKRLLLLVVSLALTSAAHAGIVGWFTSEARDWQFVQKSGGIRIAAPIEKEGKNVLPVEYWPEGNSGLAVRKIELKQKGTQIVIRIFTQLVEKDSDTARTHFSDLSGIAPGSYEVYYESAGDPAKLLGRIEIKSRTHY
jgi:hypothetical protein